MSRKEIKSLLTALALSQGELAGVLGVRQATVSDWVTGKSTPSAKHIRSLRFLVVNPHRSVAHQSALLQAHQRDEKAVRARFGDAYWAKHFLIPA